MESSRLEGSDNAELLKQRALNSSIVFLSSVAFFTTFRNLIVNDLNFQS